MKVAVSMMPNLAAGQQHCGVIAHRTSDEDKKAIGVCAGGSKWSSTLVHDPVCLRRSLVAADLLKACGYLTAVATLHAQQLHTAIA
jgi:hypothetical protein